MAIARVFTFLYCEYNYSLGQRENLLRGGLMSEGKINRRSERDFLSSFISIYCLCRRSKACQKQQLSPCCYAISTFIGSRRNSIKRGLYHPECKRLQQKIEEELLTPYSLSDICFFMRLCINYKTILDPLGDDAFLKGVRRKFHCLIKLFTMMDENPL